MSLLDVPFTNPMWLCEISHAPLTLLQGWAARRGWSHAGGGCVPRVPQTALKYLLIHPAECPQDTSMGSSLSKPLPLQPSIVS